MGPLFISYVFIHLTFPEHLLRVEHSVRQKGYMVHGADNFTVFMSYFLVYRIKAFIQQMFALGARTNS